MSTENAKEIKLPSGKVAVVGEFKGKHVREAQRIAGSKADMFMFALISLTTTIDGRPIVPEDLDELDGRDALELMGHFNEANFS